MNYPDPRVGVVHWNAGRVLPVGKAVYHYSV